MKIILAVLSAITPGLTLFLIFFFITHKNALVCRDFIGVPTRIIRKICMSDEENAKINFREYAKLKNFVKNLDISLSERESLMRSISFEEEYSTKEFRKKLEQETLRKLREEI